MARVSDVKKRWSTDQLITGIELQDWLKLLDENGWKVDPTYFHRAAWITGWSVPTTVLGRLEDARFGRQLATMEVDPTPIFVLGHWRSGTTHLHNLIGRDPNHTYSTVFQVVFPTSFLIGEKFLPQMTARFLTDTRTYDNVKHGWEEAAEDEIALAKLCGLSPYISFMFPDNAAKYERYIDFQECNDEERQRWKDALTYLVKKIMISTGGKRVVVKSCTHSARIPLLLEMYPNAKFIHIHRNPYEVFSSTLHMRSHTDWENFFHLPEEHWEEHHRAEQTLLMGDRIYQRLIEDRHLIPEQNFFEIAYEDLVGNELEVLHQIYDKFEMPDQDQYFETISEYLESIKGYKRNRLKFDQEMLDLVYDRWRHCFDAFGYPKEYERVTSIKELVEAELASDDHLAKKHVHPKMMKLFEAGGMNAVFERAEGQYFFDGEGNRYLDLLSGGGVFLLGRNHPRIHQAVKDVLDMDIPNLSIVNASVMSGMLAQRLLCAAGGHYGKVLFSNTGSEVMDLSIRFARFVTRKRRFVYLEGAFHGRTYADISMCGASSLREGMEPLMQTCTPVRPNDIDQLERELSRGDVAGFFFEPVQGMTGVVCEPEYLAAARELCTRYGALMVADEVQTGLCRTGPWFASVGAGVRPDMISVAKILSGGTVPVAALILTDEMYDEIYSKFKAGPVYFSTFAENNAAMAAGIATMDVLFEMDAPTRATQLGEILREGLDRIAERYDVVERIEGQGLLQVIYLRDSAQNLGLKLQQTVMGMADKASFGAAINVDMYRKKRIIVQIPGTDVNGIKILPPLVMTDEDVEWFLESFEDVIASYYGEQSPVASVASGFLKGALKNLVEKVPEDMMPPALAGAVGATSEKKNAEVDAPRKHNAEIKRFEDYDRDIEEHCDVVVVGSGPGGAIAARKIAQSGKRVILVEAGPIADPATFTRDPMETFRSYFWDSGMRTTRGNAMMPTLHVRALGGGSVFNSAICLRMPEYQVARWQREHGVDFSHEEMVAHYEEVEKLLKIAPTPDEVQGMRNAQFKLAADEMGIDAQPIHRNVTGCKGSSRCVVGCPNYAKNSPDWDVVDQVIEAGGRVYTSVQADKVIMRGNEAAGITGFVVDPTTGRRSLKVRITAKATVVAAGCLHTPVILQRSKIKNKLIGKNFRVHPGTWVLGEFDEEVMPWVGATQGYHSTEYLQEKGIKLETLWVSPALIAARFPGIGERYKTHLGSYKNISVFDAWVSGDDSVGQVRALPGGGKDISFNLGMGDVRRLKEANATLSEMMFAAGAHTVYTGMPGHHGELYDADDADALRHAEFSPDEMIVGSQHLYGTTPMGADRDRHVVDSYGAVYGVDNLYVADTGIMPISPAANPMHPLMAFANRIGQAVAERH